MAGKAGANSVKEKSVVLEYSWATDDYSEVQKLHMVNFFNNTLYCIVLQPRIQGLTQINIVFISSM